MGNRVSRFFSSSDLERVKEAVREAESRTSGEIVPFVVDESDSYEDALWRAGLLFGSAAFVAFALLHLWSPSWNPADIGVVTFVALLAAGIAMTAVRFLPPLKRFFAGDAIMERRASQRAAEAFISEEVFNTRDRTGILIFLSLLEHKVIVIGDSGINAKVRQPEWEGVVRTIVNGIKSGKPADGLIAAIKECGQLLEGRGMEIQPDDSNELPDSLRKG